MKSGDIVCLNNYESIKDLLGIVQIKEMLINGSFINDVKILLALNSENGESFTILQVSEEMKYFGDRTTYIENNQHIINKIKEHILLNPVNISWLQMIQLTEMYKNDDNIDFNIKKILSLYKKLLPEQEDLSFLDI